MSLANPIRCLLASATLSCAVAQGLAQGTVTFDGPPVQPPMTQVLVTEYGEAGLWFVPMLGLDGFTRNGGGLWGYPDNGTAYLQAMLGDSLTFGRDDGSVFSLVSVDLAEYSTVVSDPRKIPFVGYRPDGSTVTASFTTDGIIDGTGPLADFQTFYFGPEFSGVTEVRIPAFGWSLDNLVVAIPEPGAIPLLALGAGIFCTLRLRTRKPIVQ